MGEQQSGGGTPGRRRAHPDGLVPGRATGPHLTLDAATLEALLSAAVLRGHRADLDGEQRAVAAYRAARAAGAHHRARTRHRDDWRPRAPRRLALSMKTTLSLFVASLALGGVAVAAIGSSGSSDHPADDKVGSTPTAGAPDRPSAEPSAAATDPRGGRPGHPATAQDTEAKCRAYDQVEGNGRALDSTAWQRLVTAAGGEGEVAAYCAEQLARAAKNGPTGKADPGSAGNGADEGGAAKGSASAGAGGSGTASSSAASQGHGDNDNSGKGAEKKK